MHAHCKRSYEIIQEGSEDFFPYICLSDNYKIIMTKWEIYNNHDQGDITIMWSNNPKESIKVDLEEKELILQDKDVLFQETLNRIHEVHRKNNPHFQISNLYFITNKKREIKYPKGKKTLDEFMAGLVKNLKIE